jgi:hypothetical protein
MTDTLQSRLRSGAVTPADLDAAADRIYAPVAALREAGDDIIRASNTLMLMLAGELSLTKPALEAAIRRTLDARNAWDNAVRDLAPSCGASLRKKRR